VTVSDIHLTDGAVGLQNLSDSTWEAFYDAIKQRCITYKIDEFVLVLDGDVVDMIRSSKWAAQTGKQTKTGLQAGYSSQNNYYSRKSRQGTLLQSGCLALFL